MGSAFSLLYVKYKLIALLFRLVGGGGYMVARLTGKVPFMQPTRTIKVPSLHLSGHQIRVNVYEPPSAPTDSEGKRKPLPVHLNWHGSGFVIELWGIDSDFCSYVSKTAGCIVLDCDYRKSPEYPFPAAINDAEDVVRYVLSRPDIFDLDRISLGGFSAGAMLAVAAAAGGAFPKEQFRQLIAFYPGFGTSDDDLTDKRRQESDDLMKKTIAERGGGKLPLDKKMTDFFTEAYYFGHPPSVRKNKLASMMDIPPEDYPPTFLVVVEYDPLRKEGEIAGQRLKELGKGHQFTLIEGVSHAWDKEADKGPHGEEKKRKIYEKVAEQLKQALA